MSRSFEVGTEYRDNGVKYKTESGDQFQSWLTEPVPQGEPAFIPMKAMKPLRTYSDSSKIGDLAAFILVSDNRDKVYPDQLELDQGEIRYWGDAKRQEPDEEIAIDEFYGNKHLLPEGEKVEEERFEQTAPILFFQKERSGYVRFRGLCVLENVSRDKYKQSFENTQVWTPNYLFHLAILDTDTVPLEWIHSRVAEGIDTYHPDVWEKWKLTGQIERRRRIGSDIQPDNTGQENDYKGTVYEYQVTQIQVSDAFRRRAFELYENKCVLTEIEESPLVTLSHIVPRSDEIGYAEDITNVMLLNWTHHVAFDSGIFTLDTDLRLRVNPAFKANDSWLRRTLLERDGKKLDLPEDVYLSEDRIRERNASIEWWPLSK